MAIFERLILEIVPTFAAGFFCAYWWLNAT